MSYGKHFKCTSNAYLRYAYRGVSRFRNLDFVFSRGEFLNRLQMSFEGIMSQLHVYILASYEHTLFLLCAHVAMQPAPHKMRAACAVAVAVLVLQVANTEYSTCGAT